MSKASSSEASEEQKNEVVEKKAVVVKADPDKVKLSLEDRLLAMLLSVPAALVKYLTPNSIKQRRIRNNELTYEAPRSNCYCKSSGFIGRRKL